ncbi:MULTISPECIES: hypothetical protein [unclassified Fusibacter]|uniref:hypothetical protein n=1 Tax=unclassified Fusibacter TaxID=2624464 RepID=UPI001011DEE4|nr:MULTISPECIES: hypothetical protein [unclassified Fusibacter]MCK8059127.1 hypothetical protein [Fusibacter sp. A2]NPE22536.1 hypothetical protein [Fusibacter sp. A1]RXV60638.1 hypothetical protein DWB64_11860 [Fusibacter sp. A1]
MKRKTMMITTALAAVLVLALVAYAGTPANAGYEAFKELMKTHSENEMNQGTVSGNLTIVDNGETLVSITGSAIGDHDSETMQADIQLVTGELNKQLSVYGMDNLIYIYDVENNDIYVGQDDHTRESRREKKFDKDDGDFSENGEALLDYFVGDMANDFTLVKDSDGSMDISFELTKSEMPAIINLMASAKSDDQFENHESFESDVDLSAYPLWNELKNAHIEKTELVDQVEVEYINITFDRDTQNELVGIAFEVTVSGLDENQKAHVMTVSGAVAFDSASDVIITPITLEGKNVYELPQELMNDEM